MKISIVHRLNRCIVTYHFLSCFVVFLAVEVSGRTDIKTKLLLQNIRTHLAQKVDEIVQQKECESGLTLCKNIKSKEEEEEGDEEKSEEIPPPPKIARGAHKPLIKVSPKDVIQTLMPKVHKSFGRKYQKEGEIEKHKKFHPPESSEKSQEEKEVDNKSSGHHKPVRIPSKTTEKPPERPEKELRKPIKEEFKRVAKPREDEITSKKGKTEEEKIRKTQIKDETLKKEKKRVEKVEKKVLQEKEEREGVVSLTSLGEAFVFALDSDEVDNVLCRKHSQIYLKQLKKNKIWSLMMYDASAKLPSGILQGNVNQYGDFDECLAINAVFKTTKTRSEEPSGIKGRYCLTNIDVSTDSESTAVRQALERAESFQFIKSTIYDPGHFIPRFSSVNWGLCVPSACLAEDVEKFIKSRLQVYNGTSGLLFQVKVEDENCVVKDELKFEFHSAMLMTMLFYLTVIATSVYATYLDKKKNVEQVLEEATKDSEPYEPEAHSPPGRIKSIIMAFSLKKNVEKLLSGDEGKDSIGCINGIKSIFTIMLYFAHKIIQLGMTPYSNRIFLTKISNEPATAPLRASIIYTDSFLLISGVLTSYNLSREISAKGSISWLKKAAARFIRLTPALFAVLLFYAHIWDHIGSGPTWNLVVKKNSELCQKYMWRNLLYVQNFFAFEDMCAPQTHQLALDMQLSMLAPLFVYLLHTYDKVGVGILQALFLFSSIMRYISASNNYLSVVIYHGMSVSQLYRTANLLYGQSLHRASPYILGIIVGYYLKKYDRGFDMPKAFAALGWIIAFALGFYSVVSPSHLAFRSYQYDVQEAAQYAALSPVAWAIALSWLIVACHLGYGGKLNEFLCQKSLLVFSRISYSVYLTQFLVFFYKVGVKRIPEMFSFTGSFNITELFIVIAISTVVTLLFDIPMMEVKRIILDKLPLSTTQGPVSEKDNPENEITDDLERTPILEDDYEILSREDLQGEIKQEEKDHMKEEEGEEEDDEEIGEEDEGTGEVESEEDIEDEDGDDEEVEDTEEVDDEELEMHLLRRSTRLHFNEDSEDKEWFKVEPDTKESHE